MQNIKENANIVKPRVLFDELTEKQGGILSCKSIGSLPRDRKQVENARACSSSMSSVNGDPLLAVILKCKEDERADVKNAYVRKVVAAPEPAAVLFLDKQLNDIRKFCCNNVYWSALQVDPTFDLGQFSVTTSQYKNLLLVNHRTGEHPSMIGPLLVHYKKSKSSFNVLVDAMIDKQPEIKNLHVLGTDGESELAKPFKQHCPSLIHLLCFNHVRRNIKEKLSSMKIPKPVAKMFLNDIFGEQSGNVFEHGLVDSESEANFDRKVAQLKSIWHTRASPFTRQDNSLDFHEWFVKYQVQRIKKNMLKPVRVSAGLGSPNPKPFYTNAVESMNRLLSDETDHKPQSMPEFCEKAKSIALRQQRDVERAIVGLGPYRLHPKIKDMQIDEETWIGLSELERSNYIEMVLTADVSCISSTDPSGKIQEVSGLDLLATAASTLQEECTSTGNGLPIPYQQLRSAVPGTAVHDSTLKGMYEKACRYLSSPGHISLAPGNNDARMVKSHHSNRPHFVAPGRGKGQFLCDSSCPSFSAHKMCSHCIVTAQCTGQLQMYLSFLTKSRSSKKKNYTNATKLDMPQFPQKKGGVGPAKRQVMPPVTVHTQRQYSTAQFPVRKLFCTSFVNIDCLF